MYRVCELDSLSLCGLAWTYYRVVQSGEWPVLCLYPTRTWGLDCIMDNDAHSLPIALGTVFLQWDNNEVHPTVLRGLKIQLKISKKDRELSYSTIILELIWFK